MSDQFEGLELQESPDGVTSPGQGRARAGRPSLAELAETDPTQAGKRLVKEWEASNKHVKNLKEQWKVNRNRAKGYTGVALIKQQNENKAYIPVGAKQSVAGMNKAARLKRRLRATMFADEAKPEAVPSTDEDQDRDAAELSTRVLEDVCSEGNLHLHKALGDAFDLASDYGSGFVRFWVDPHAGGSRPREIWATPDAQTAEAPLVPDAMGLFPDPLIRYVRADGMITDNPTEAERVWLPRLRRELLTGKSVRFIPHTAEDLWDAEAVLIGSLVPLGVVRSMFPEEVARVPEDRLEQMVQYRPEAATDLLPIGKQDRRYTNPTDRDDAYVFLLAKYQCQTAEYPRGHYFVVLGDGELVYHDDWYDDEADRPLDIPLTQVAQYHEEDNPYYQALMEQLGPGNEVRALMLGAFLEHLDKFLNRRTFLPLTSVLKPEQLQSPTGNTLPINPGGAPIYEELPDFPAVAEKMYAMVTTDLDDESGLQEAAQGLNAPSVQSGKHAQQVVEQVIIGLSELRQNAVRAYVRSWRVILQLIRAYYTVPQKLKWLTEDGGYKVEEWTGADLGSTSDVRIQKGSFTQLSPIHKANLALTYFGIADEQGNRVLDLSDVRHLMSGNVGGYLGLRDNPHANRVRRQINKWRDGPPEGWQPPQPVAQVNPQTGQIQQVVPPDPVLGAIFAPRPSDEEPTVAQLRAEELGRAVSSSRFGRFPPAWQQGLVQAYVAARQAAGLLTVAEQQQAQQAAQQAAMQAEQAKQQGAMQGKQLDAQTRLQQEQLRQAGAIRVAEIDEEGDVEAERLRTVASVVSAGATTPDTPY